MKNIVKLGLLALVATAVSLQAVYDEVTVLTFVNQIPGHPEIAYRVLAPNADINNPRPEDILQDWQRFSEEDGIVNITLNKRPDGFEKIEFKKVGYDKKGWNLQPYDIFKPSQIYQPSGNNQTLSLGFKENSLTRFLGITVKPVSKYRVVRVTNISQKDSFNVIFSHDRVNDLAKYSVPAGQTKLINLDVDAPLYYKSGLGHFQDTDWKGVPAEQDKSFIDAEGKIYLTFSPSGKYSTAIGVMTPEQYRQQVGNQ